MTKTSDDKREAGDIMNWHPIKSAPTGPLLLWVPEWKMVTVGRRFATSPSAASYNTFKALLSNGWNECQPTHWMYVPPPPPKEQEGGQS